MGLGSTLDVSLNLARRSAEKWRAVSLLGRDPIKEREKERREAERNLHCLADIALDDFESRKAELKGDGKAGRWFSPLELHILPKLGKVPVADITQIDIRDALKPIWHSKADTARKAMNRLSLCLKHAAALGLDVDLQATEKAKALLGQTRHKVTYIPAMPWADVPTFFETLAEPTATLLALRMLILTAVRSAPIRFMRYDQIDGDVWTVPAQIMKGRLGTTSDFRVPLSSAALAVVEQTKPFERDGYLFPGARKGVISDMAMNQHMARAELPYRPHGFRTSFRVWTDFQKGVDACGRDRHDIAVVVTHALPIQHCAPGHGFGHGEGQFLLRGDVRQRFDGRIGAGRDHQRGGQWRDLQAQAGGEGKPRRRGGQVQSDHGQ
jgi:integrase